jgi:mannan endo-1,4-beta-mannosidase
VDFIQRHGDGLFAGRESFWIIGANNYYLGNAEEATAVSVLDMAREIGCNTLRIWAFVERDKPGLERLDRAIYLAGQRGIRLILALENYWSDFGGVPAYVKRFALASTAEFYRDAQCRAAYREWVEQIVTRVNAYTGLPYCEDPTILAWELMNEPRCTQVSNGEEVLLGWIDEMSRFVRRMAARQLVAVGDEGFFRSPQSKSWLYDGSQGVNCAAILSLDAIDFGTCHLYIDRGWANGKDPSGVFGRRWIQEHIEAGRRANKPMLLEEFGVALPPEERAALYAEWLGEVKASGGLGALVWMIGLPEGPGQPYALDPYAITKGPELRTLRSHATTMIETE